MLLSSSSSSSCGRLLLASLSLCLSRRLSSSSSSCHRVASYNVLSSHLSQPDYFSSCSPPLLLPDYRYSSLTKKLDDEVQRKAVICLQEVSSDWAGKLHTYFSRHNYHFVTALYGNKFDGYMGVGMAFPHDDYDLLDADIKRLVDTKKTLPRSPPLSPLPASSSLFPSLFLNQAKTAFTKFFSNTLMQKITANRVAKEETASSSSSSSLSSEKLWSEVMRRKNEIITLKLKCKRTEECFLVATYHMPCVFRLPEVMAVHAALAAQHVHHLSSVGEEEEDATASSSVEEKSKNTANTTTSRMTRKGRVLPYILAGDFNIVPHSSVYELLTQGAVPPALATSIHPSDLENVWSASSRPLRSAYMTANNKEPDFTNHARIRKEDPFIETLDYIFLSPEWDVKGVLELPHRDEVTGPYPTHGEPSDHVLIATTVAVKKQKRV